MLQRNGWSCFNMAEYIINSKEKLKTILEIEKNIYLPKNKNSLEYRLRNPFKTKVQKYLTLLRKYEYLCFKRDNCKNKIFSKLYSLKIKFTDIKMKKLGLILGLEIIPDSVGEGLRICHHSVIINGFVGKNCTFHGNNVLGNKASGEKNKVPRIGSNVDVGIGAMIIGDVTIADNCVIGAGAVVTKSFTTPGSVIAGVPAKLVK